MNGKFVAYYRVSTEQQGKSGLGQEAQRQAVRGYLNGGNWKLIAEFEEQESGKNNDRPKLAAALKLCRLTGATLIVAKLDRLSRSAAFLVNLMESRVKFVCVDNPNANELTIHILAAVAQQERKAISERTRAALGAAKKRGVALGNPNLEAVRPTDTSAANAKRGAMAREWSADLAEVIADIRESGTSTLIGIAGKLNERGITTRRGGKWSAVQVRRVMERLG
jgi:DNA invertase Pin-like site-specific DNA recombinase